MTGGYRAAVRMRPMRPSKLASTSRVLPMRASAGPSRRVTGRRNRLLALALWNRDSGRCGRCGLPIILGHDWRSRYALTIGHIRPHSQGGTYDLSNLRPEHRGCNLAAGTRDPRPAPRIITP